MAYPNLSPGARLQAVKLKDSDGNPIGAVKEWMMDVDAGRVVYVLASLGDQSATGATEYIAIPWELMQADKENGGYRVKASSEQWQNGPRISTEQINALVTDTAFLDQVYQYYKIQPSWQATGQGNASAENNSSGGTAPTQATTTASNPNGNVDGEGQPMANDLKEQRDDIAGTTGAEKQGLTNEEHGLGSGYGGGQPVT